MMVMSLQRQWEVIQMAPARMALWIWQATFGSGWQIGMMLIRVIQSATMTMEQLIECCVAARGTSAISASVLPTASGATQQTPTAAAGFVAPAHPDAEILVSASEASSEILKREFL